MNLFKRLMCLLPILVTTTLMSGDQKPNQQSIDSLLQAIDRMAVENYVQTLKYVDQAISKITNQPELRLQYLYLRMKKSGVLLKGKAHSEAYQNLLDVEDEVNRQNDPLVKGFFHTTAAFIYGNQGNADKAIESYQRALEFYRETGEPRKIAVTYNNLADTYLTQGQYELAITEIGKALAIQRKQPIADASIVFSTAGEIELALKDYQKALLYFREAFAASDSLQPSHLPVANLHIANALIGLKEFNEARAFIDNCKGQLSNDEGLTFTYLQTQQNYFRATRQYDSALFYGEKALTLSQHIAARQSIAEIEIVKLNDHYLHENDLLRQQVEAKSFQQKLYLIIVLLSILSVGFLMYAMAVKRNDLQLLKRQNEEIASQAKTLQDLTSELTSQGEALRQMNVVLEAKVQERTTRLKAKNEQLTKYAFFNAHKLRAPIATLLGLKQLLHLSTAVEDKEKIVDQILATTERFDEVVRETQLLLHDMDEANEGPEVSLRQ